MSTKNGGPAFPTGTPTYTSGMSLRDYFAAKAMAAVLVDCANDGHDGPFVAELAYGIADAMLAARDA